MFLGSISIELLPFLCVVIEARELHKLRAMVNGADASQDSPYLQNLKFSFYFLVIIVLLQPRLEVLDLCDLRT